MPRKVDGFETKREKSFYENNPNAMPVAGIRSDLDLAPLTSALCLGAAKAKPVDAPWFSLLNGRDLVGWKIIVLTNPAPAVVEDGAMWLRQRTNTIEHTFVASEREYVDFILELDVKDDPSFNSGISLCCADASAEAKVRLNGYQIKIDHTPRAWTSGVFEDFGNSRKWLHDLADNGSAQIAGGVYDVRIVKPAQN